MKFFHSSITITLLLAILILNDGHSQDYKILESDYNHLKLEFNFNNQFSVQDIIVNGIKFTKITDTTTPLRKPGDPFLPTRFYEIGIPQNTNAFVTVLESEHEVLNDKFVIATPDSMDQPFKQLNYNQDIYGTNSLFPIEQAKLNSESIFRYIKIASLSIAPIQFNPVQRTLILNKKIVVRIDFKPDNSFTDLITPMSDKMTEEFIKTNLINSIEALTFLGKVESISDSPQANYWYDPNKDYYKIYLSEKGVYRLTYDLLVSENLPLNNVDIDKIQIFNNGIEVPLFIKDTDINHFFNSGDYLEFVGFPPQPSPHSALNIYNVQNVYWFSYEADSTGKRYVEKDGTPAFWFNSFSVTQNTIHYEVDSLYERLGHASNDQRDYWFWGKSSGTNGILANLFSGPFPSLPRIDPMATLITLRVNMHGMTTNQCINPDHKVKISMTSQLVGEHTWDGPNSSTFQTQVDLSQIHIFPQNNLQVAAYGDIGICPNDTNAVPNDEIRVNWFEIDYPQELRTYENWLTFKSPPNIFNKTRFQVFNWQRDNIKIFIPQRSEMIINADITNDQYKSVLFVDNLFAQMEYFCVAEDYFLLPDSIKKDNNVSNLRNITNGVDYLIITENSFSNSANELAEFRRYNFPDTSIASPRISVVEIQDIYDEFSYGLLDPYAIKNLISYIFNNWTSPAISYVVLFGDMSYDYRKLSSLNRPNFIPSIPYHARPYGQAASDNNFVAIVGTDDVLPDLAIGRISCETVDEAEILVNKILNYPDDNGKAWKQNILLMSSGQNLQDENYFQFNNSNIFLDNVFLKPNGLISAKIFRFPNDSTQIPFQGDGPEIRAGFNSGAVIASYYGHGGGYQWDLVFNNDDIYLLQNGGRLPFVSSVTCYTAHFDNQDVFGEQFNKVPGKGSIAFWGSSGLTFWSAGKSLNEKFFNQVFNNKIYIIGKAILNSKSYSGGSISESQIALLTLLGDPVLKLALPDKPDFVVKSSDISINPKNPLKNDTIAVSVKIKNLGIIFPGDSVSVNLKVSDIDTSYSVDTVWVGSFGEIDSVIFRWTPQKGAYFNLEISVNQVNPIEENDISDNYANSSFVVYDLGEPNIIKPIDGFIFNKDSVEFVFSDAGYYSLTDLKYYIEIDTTINFKEPIIKSDLLSPNDGKLVWTINSLTIGHYFWRTRIINADDSSRWSEIRVFTILDSSKLGYYISDILLKSLSQMNVNYIDSLKSLIINTYPLPPRPANNKLLDFYDISLPNDLHSISAITTDGSYFYIGHLAYYAGPSKIYKFGTGLDGTIAGQNYGEIPGILVPIWHSIFYYEDNSGGNLYIATGDAYSLLKVNPVSGDTSRVAVPDGLINSSDSKVHNGAFYINTDGRYVYNVSYIDENGNFKYRLRTLDPLNNWSKIKEDLTPSGTSYGNFTGFFVAENYFYPYENYQEGWMRRINLNSGIYEEEWRSFEPYQGFYAWSYDWSNDIVYGSVFQTNFTPKIAKFIGKYFDAIGNIRSSVVGPSSKWNDFSYKINDFGNGGSYSIFVNGLNNITKIWDTLAINPTTYFDLGFVDPNLYPFIKVQINLVDSSYGTVNPIQIKNVGISYIPLPELLIARKNIISEPDTVLQGLSIILKTQISNIGYNQTKNVIIDYYISENENQFDTVLFSNKTDILPFSQVELVDTIDTTPYLFRNFIKAKINYDGREFNTFNNSSENTFFVARDSTNPLFNITFDGREIINGDIISSEPEVIMTLEDNSPLPLTENLFTILHNNKSLRFSNSADSLRFEYTPHPNSRAVITWTPKLEDGEHTLSIFAKDSSGNPFSSSNSTYKFSVYNNPNLLQVYNYPNPFKDNTHFTFELRGINPPEEFKIKIFTVAGRLIRIIDVPISSLHIGFNTIAWDGHDEDGDEIANGLYFYKIISKHGDEVKTATQKLAKIK